MTKVWSKELGIFKIRVACVAPGFIDTPSTRESLSEAVIDKWKKSVSLNRLGELKNVGEAIKFIIQNDYFNGSVVSVDGGLSI
jgi:3-oxoacyl-[acyl-carrier protein] reductase